MISQASGTKDADDAGDIAAADGTLGKLFAAADARHHVTALEQQAVDDGVHAHLTQVIVFHRVELGIGCNQSKHVARSARQTARKRI